MRAPLEDVLKTMRERAAKVNVKRSNRRISPQLEGPPDEVVERRVVLHTRLSLWSDCGPITVLSCLSNDFVSFPAASSR